MRWISERPIPSTSCQDPLIGGSIRRTMLHEDVIRREALEKANSGGDLWSVLAASRPVLHRHVVPPRLADDPLRYRERVADPGLHQARQLHRFRHGYSGRRLDGEASIRALIPSSTSLAFDRRGDFRASARREVASLDGPMPDAGCLSRLARVPAESGSLVFPTGEEVRLPRRATTISTARVGRSSMNSALRCCSTDRFLLRARSPE